MPLDEWEGRGSLGIWVHSAHQRHKFPLSKPLQRVLVLFVEIDLNSIKMTFYDILWAFCLAC